MKTFISLDLEMNKDDVTGKVDKIIQIGAVAFTLEPFVILEELSVIINPNEIISIFITQLTGITQEMANNGVELFEGYAKLCELKIKHNAEAYPVVWGHGDCEHLWKKMKDSGTYTDNDRFIFGRRNFDVKTLYQSYRLANNLKTQSGLKKSCNNLGLIIQGPMHNALNDSIATAQAFKKLIELYKIKT